MKTSAMLRPPDPTSELLSLISTKTSGDDIADDILLLLGAGADPNVRDKNGLTSLHWAAGFRKLNSVRLLLEAGADPNAYTEDGDKTCLHILATSPFTLSTLCLLLQFGADPDLKNGAGDTPLHICACKNNIEAAALLVRSGADIKVTDSQGATPAQRAFLNHHERLSRRIIMESSVPAYVFAREALSARRAERKKQRQALAGEATARLAKRKALDELERPRSTPHRPLHLKKKRPLL